MKAVTVVLSPAGHDALVRLKESQGGTYSQVIESALDAYANALRSVSRSILPDSVQPASQGGVFNPGDEVRVNNPMSRYHGRILTVVSWSKPFGVVRGTIDDAFAVFNADYLEYPEKDSQKKMRTQ